MQLQTMNQMMKKQFQTYPVCSVLILGVAGGNGLEHINQCKFQKVYGVDINKEYLSAVKKRYFAMADVLECLQLDIIKEADKLPKAELLIANLLVEYIGYADFQKAVRYVQPKYVSCIIQINTDDSWVSNSPYIHAFDDLDKIHCRIDENCLTQAMNDIGFQLITQIEKPLPNGKKLLQLDYGS